MPDAGVEQLSKLSVYSIGHAAENKELNSFMLEIYPSETLPDNSGEIAVVPESLSANHVNASGAAVQSTTTVGATIRAEWIPIGCPNRMTPPDVRRGEMVFMYRFGDSKKFYWATAQADLKFRKLETVVYALSGTSDENAEPSLDNSYYLEYSTHKGLIHLHTSNANKEVVTYDIKLNTAEGIFTFEDGLGNKLTIDSLKRMFKMENAVGSVLNMTGPTFDLKTSESISMTTTTFSVKAETSSITSTSHTVTATTEVIGPTTIDGTLSQIGGGSAAFGGDVTIHGDVATQGSMGVSGQMGVGGEMGVGGIIHTTKLISDQNIVAPNVP